MYVVVSAVDYGQPTINVVMSVQKVVTALDRTWHPEHFFCAQCGSFFGPEGIVFSCIELSLRLLCIHTNTNCSFCLLFVLTDSNLLPVFVIPMKVFMKRMEKPIAGRITSTCLHQNVAAVPEPFWRTTSQR